MVWHDILDPADHLLDELAAKYKIHPLHIEDCRHRNQNAKVEDGRDYLFIVIKSVEINGDGELCLGDLDVIMGADWIITVQEMDCSGVRDVIQQVRTETEGQTPDRAMYRILDRVVDTYTPVLDRYNGDIEQLEEEILEDPNPKELAELFSIRRALIEMRRVTVNTREVVGGIARMRTTLVSSELAPFLRDVYDHLVRALDNIDIQRDLVAGVVEIYLSSLANRTNNVMKALTIFGTVTLPALLISSFYGMNLQHLPFVDSPHAVLLVTLIMAACTALLLILLRRSGWH